MEKLIPDSVPDKKEAKPAEHIVRDTQSRKYQITINLSLIHI